METQLDLLLIKQQQQQAIRQFSIHIDKVHTTNSYSPGRLELNRFQALVLCGVWRVSHRIVQPQTHTHTLTEKWMNIGIESVLIENIHNLHTPRQLSTVECECWGDGVLLCMPSPFCRNWHRCKLFAFWLAVTSCQLLRCKLHLQLQLIWLIWLIWITLVYIDFSCKTIFFALRGKWACAQIKYETPTTTATTQSTPNHLSHLMNCEFLIGMPFSTGHRHRQRNTHALGRLAAELLLELGLNRRLRWWIRWNWI